ncbi:hypothetical protein WA158_005677 [Blastocystis sp. Blastoise]
MEPENPIVEDNDEGWIPANKRHSYRANSSVTHRNILTEVLKEEQQEKEQVKPKEPEEKPTTEVPADAPLKKSVSQTFKKIQEIVADPKPYIEKVNKVVEVNKEKLEKAVDEFEDSYSKTMLNITSGDEQKVKLRKRKSKRNNKKVAAPKPEGDADKTASAPTTSSDSEEEVETAKPLFYPHSFEKQPSQIDVITSENKGMGLIGLLKFKEFEGLYNLLFIYLIYCFILLIWNNLESRGLIFNFEFIYCPSTIYGVISSAIILFIISFGCLSFCFFFLEKLRVRFHINNYIFFTMYAILQIAFIGSSTYVIWNAHLTPFICSVPMMLCICIALKQHSFIFTNYAFERNNTSSNKVEIPLSKRHYLYFLVAPTLVYELSYPKTDRIRVSYLISMLTQAIFCFLVCYFILVQFITPYLSDLSLSFISRICSVAIPAFCVWLFGFYMLFHCLLNIDAEILMFADRQFYTDWWNATDIGTFWRSWNQPVHVWCLRHVYVETQVYGNISKPTASAATFLFSGIIHELVCCVMFRCFTPFFLLGMAVQAPMAIVSRRFDGTFIGNIITWLAFFFGQPFLEMSYANLWFKTHDSWFCGAV